MPVKQRQTLSTAFAEFVAISLPDALEHTSKLTNELVQFSVWLVGLAGSAIGLILAKPELVTQLGLTAQRMLVLSLLATIVLCVLHRLALFIFNRRSVAHNIELHMFALGHLAFAKTEPPAILQTQWTREEIIENIQGEFGFGSAAIAKSDATLELCQTIYQSLFDLRKSIDAKEYVDFNATMNAFAGKSATDAASQQVDANSQERIRRAAIVNRRWDLGSTVLFFLACSAFTVGATTAVISLLARMPLSLPITTPVVTAPQPLPSKASRP